MSEVEDNKMVELTVVRGTVCAGKDVKRGDTILVPSETKTAGVYPVRWWINNKKAARTPEEFKEFCAEIDVATGAAEPAKDAKK